MAPGAFGSSSPGRGALRRCKAALARRGVAVALVSILVLSLGLRAVGTNWDRGAHLHPDERYMSIVADNISWPGGLGEYLDVATSPLSPYNTAQGSAYVYGTLPLFGVKLVATLTGEERYGELNQIGRRVAALVDTLTVLVVFLIGALMMAGRGRSEAARTGLLAAALYALTVTAIQHAHFFTTDVWLTFFGALTFLAAAYTVARQTGPGSSSPWAIVLLPGVALGLTVACKASGALAVLPVAVALVGRSAFVASSAGWRRALLRLVAETGVVGVSAYVAFRIVSPYTFGRSSWLDLSVNDSFREALENQASLTAGPSLFPPAYQWMLSSRVWAPLENLVRWQLGVVLGVAALIGLGVLLVLAVRTGWSMWRHRARELRPDAVIALVHQLMLLSFVVAVFLWVGTRFVHSGRYLVPITPLLAVAAAYGVTVLTRGRSRLWATAAAVLVVGTGLWALAFTHVYREPNTRIAATDWIEANVPAGSAIANEHWDDALPVGGRWGLSVEQAKELGGYVGVTVPVFDLDDETKLRKLYDTLSAADYYVLSSPRAWKTIGRLPALFPLMSRFYDELFAERLGFARVATFESSPELLGVRIDDLRAEEAFWVYDHPPVAIYRREGPLEWDGFRTVLCPERVEPHCA